MGFVTAFRGRRDGYEVPIALAEHGLLDTFLTDQFCGPIENAAAHLLPPRLAEKLRSRFDARIPSDRVARLRTVALREAVHTLRGGSADTLRGGSADTLYDRFDPAYGLATAAAARRGRSDLFLYSPYAMSALTARYAHDPRKIILQFHPHFHLEREVMLADSESAARAGQSRKQEFDSVLNPFPARIEADESWRLADHVVCTSSFTKRSLIEQGASADAISVIPYGVELPPLPAAVASDAFHVLFVGTGLYRKGLHHLLAAWKKARLPKDATLTIVSRAMEPDLLALLRTVEGIDHRPGVSSAELSALYAKSTLFVMPSLVEGFGQVYLEALSHGLPVLGTANTCVPDLGTPDEGLLCTAPGQSDQLAAELEALALSLPSDSAIRQRARNVAERFSWQKFRNGIAAVAESGGPSR